MSTVSYGQAFSKTSPLRMPRLSDVLFQSVSHTFESIAPVPSNVEAIEAAISFADRDAPFVAIVGPSGWGKSHLVEAVLSRMRARDGTAGPEVATAVEWLETLHRRDPQAPLILDNVMELHDKPRMRNQFRIHLERRVRTGQPTMLSITAPKINRQIRAQLPNAKDWILSGIGVPAPIERDVIVRQMGEVEGMVLAAELIWLISRKIHGNGRTLLGALKRLRIQQSKWLGARSVVRGCGILAPFFADNGCWDFREVVVEAVETFAVAAEPAFRSDLALFTLHKVAQLPEEELARYFEIEPRNVFSRVNAFDRKLQSDPSMERDFERFTEFLIREIEKG